ncbi:MAG: hypothetical protein ACJAV1_002506 [Paraglaciecola sp.]|jgi:hypothetical protein
MKKINMSIRINKKNFATIFELLNISSGDAIKVDNPFSYSGPREVVPLGVVKKWHFH